MTTLTAAELIARLQRLPPGTQILFFAGWHDQRPVTTLADRDDGTAWLGDDSLPAEAHVTDYKSEHP